MGLDIGKAHWAYSGFMRFRTRLAEAEGLDLRQMYGFSFVGQENEGRPWTNGHDGKDDTILRPFLDHSDCDGELTPAECEQVVDRIEEIVNTWDHPDHDVTQGRLLVAEMRTCIIEQTSLEFT